MLAGALMIAGGHSVSAKPAQGPIAMLTATLPPAVRAALPSITEGGRRLLALRGYLRSEKGLEKRWSWSEEEIAEYVESPEHATALADIDKVREAFEAANDGYSLKVNTKVRSLDDQIESWNRNKSVGTAGSQLGDDFSAWLAANGDATPAEARNFLRAWQPANSVSIAVPGLSPHGRARAFDFQVQAGVEIIAGADTGAVTGVWEKDGWTDKLRAAVMASGAPFDGPLEKPREPWHYDYEPTAVAAKPVSDSALAMAYESDFEIPPLPRRSDPPIPRPRPPL